MGKIIELFQNLLTKNSDESNAIKKIERFSKRYLILSSDSFDDYIKGSLIILVLLQRIILTLYTISSLIIVILDNKVTRIITNDPLYLLGNTWIGSFMLVFCLSIEVFFGIYVFNEERNKSLDVLIFLELIKNKSFVIKLNDRNRKKFGLRINLMTEYILGIIYPTLSTFVALLFAVGMVFAYFDLNSGYNQSSFLWIF